MKWPLDSSLHSVLQAVNTPYTELELEIIFKWYSQMTALHRLMEMAHNCKARASKDLNKFVNWIDKQVLKQYNYTCLMEKNNL